MYKMEVDPVKKVFYIYAAGFFSMEEGTRFIAEYMEKTGTISPNQYNLIVDSKEVKPSAPDVANALQELMKLYMNVPFKKRFIVKLDSAIGMSQVNRLSKEIPGFDTIVFVDSSEQAHTML